MIFLAFYDKKKGKYGKAFFFMIFFSLDECLVFVLMTWYDIMGCILSS